MKKPIMKKAFIVSLSALLTICFTGCSKKDKNILSDKEYLKSVPYCYDNDIAAGTAIYTVVPKEQSIITSQNSFILAANSDTTKGYLYSLEKPGNDKLIVSLDITGEDFYSTVSGINYSYNSGPVDYITIESTTGKKSIYDSLGNTVVDSLSYNSLGIECCTYYQSADYINQRYNEICIEYVAYTDEDDKTITYANKIDYESTYYGIDASSFTRTKLSSDESLKLGLQKGEAYHGFNNVDLSIAGMDGYYLVGPSMTVYNKKNEIVCAIDVATSCYECTMGMMDGYILCQDVYELPLDAKEYDVYEKTKYSEYKFAVFTYSYNLKTGKKKELTKFNYLLDKINMAFAKNEKTGKEYVYALVCTGTEIVDKKLNGNGKTLYLNAEGDIMSVNDKFNYHKIERISENRYLATKTDVIFDSRIDKIATFFLLDEKGNVITTLSDYTLFTDAQVIAIGNTNSGYRFIDYDGKLIDNTVYSYVSACYGNKCYAETADGKYYMLALDGGKITETFVLDNSYISIEDYDEYNSADCNASASTPEYIMFNNEVIIKVEVQTNGYYKITISDLTNTNVLGTYIGVARFLFEVSSGSDFNYRKCLSIINIEFSDGTTIYDIIQ